MLSFCNLLFSILHNISYYYLLLYICIVACQNYYRVRIATCITGTMDIHNPCQNCWLPCHH